MPKISIIVPAYNEEKHIARCLDSILNQTFSDFEVLCIDDGSTDSTFDIIKKYSEADSRIIPFKNTGKGVASARNLGLDNAKGEYISFVDSDDFIQPQTNEFLLKAIVENDADMSVCNTEITSEFNIQTFEYKFKKVNFEYILDNHYTYPIHCICMRLIKRDIINERFQNYKVGEDTLFGLHLWLNSKCTIFIDLPLYVYYMNEKSVTINTKTNYSDKAWLDRAKVCFLSYQILNNSDINKNSFIFFLETGFRNLLLYRSGSLDNSEEIKKLFSENFSIYKKSSNFSFKKKIYVFTVFKFPVFYNFYEKLKKKIKKIL